MTNAEKQKLLREAEEYIQRVCREAESKIPEAKQKLAEAERAARSARDPDSKAVTAELKHLAEIELRAKEEISRAPYFARCDARLDAAPNTSTYYVGKYSSPEQSIYSWVSPIARLRFEQPGAVKLIGGRGQVRTGVMNRLDQYLITDRRIIFFATQTKDKKRELVYQEHFSDRKTAFVLPEIVEKMERAQDDVIRAEPRGPFLIAGPAGSGKTTLALHRVAYLTQSPVTAPLFPIETILVLVQDYSTKAYFSDLLPSLGIRGVTIQTFPEWAFWVLKLERYEFVNRPGRTELERDVIEHLKLQAIRHGKISSSNNISEALSETYRDYFPSETLLFINRTIRSGKLDRFDLTCLLTRKLRQEDHLTKEEKVYSATSRGKARSKYIQKNIAYSLLVLDEAENYLPEQIEILKTTVSPETRAIVYVGDLAQQTALGTLRSWSEVKESFQNGRQVILGKVYRSSREIIQYIHDLGYEIDVPGELRSGKAVKEYVRQNVSQKIAEIRKIAEQNRDVLMGVLALTPEELLPYYGLVKDFPKVKVLTISEAQGVEFDIVCLLTLDHQVRLEEEYSEFPELKMAKQRIIKDQIYVGLTRAMNELHVFGSNRE